MRKADYAHLAARIRDERRLARHTTDEKARALVLDALESVAREFAARASVDRAAFLTACGIAP